MYDSEGQFKNHNDLNVDWLELETIKRNFPDWWDFWLNDNVEGEFQDLCDKLFNTNPSICNREIYDIFVSDPNIINKYRIWWLENDLTIEEETYLQALQTVFASTPVSKFRDSTD